MDTKIYLDKSGGLLITTRFSEWENNMRLGIFPQQHFLLIDTFALKSNHIILKSVSFDKVPLKDFVTINNYLKYIEFDEVAIHECNLINVQLPNCKHLILGIKVKLNLSNEILLSIQKITFLSLKTFRGKILNDLNNIKDLIVWDDIGFINELLKKIPYIEILQLFKTNLETLDISLNHHLCLLELYNSKKLKRLEFTKDNMPNKISFEMCPNLVI